MTKIISVNAGSSSLKFQLFEMPNETVLTSGVAERIGLEEGIFTIKVDGEKHVQKLPIPDHSVAVDLLLKANMADHRNDCILTLCTLISVLFSLVNIYFIDSIVGIIISAWH